MKPRKILVSRKLVSGLTVRSKNQDEFNPETAKIAGLWQDFFAKKTWPIMSLIGCRIRHWWVFIPIMLPMLMTTTTPLPACWSISLTLTSAMWCCMAVSIWYLKHEGKCQRPSLRHGMGSGNISSSVTILSAAICLTLNSSLAQKKCRFMLAS